MYKVLALVNWFLNKIKRLEIQKGLNKKPSHTTKIIGTYQRLTGDIHY
jgi:hypothetical protein